MSRPEASLPASLDSGSRVPLLLPDGAEVEDRPGCPNGPQLPEERDTLRESVCQIRPSEYGISIGMKKTLNVDDKLLKEAKAACGAKTDTDAIRQGLEVLVRRAANQRLRALLGTEPGARDVPRRREAASRKRRVA